MANPEHSVPVPEDRATITCLYCGKTQEVGRRAMTVTCKFCHKALKLEDIRIKDYQARRSIDTVGVVTVEKKGQVFSDTIRCGGLIVRGKIKSSVESRGPVLIGPEAEIVGDVTAPTLAVGAGAILEGRYSVGPVADEPDVVKVVEPKMPDGGGDIAPEKIEPPAPPPRTSPANPVPYKAPGKPFRPLW